MKQDQKNLSSKGGKRKVKLFKPRKKKSVEENAAIEYLQAQYEKITPDEIKIFKDFPLSQKTLKGLKENNYITPTEIQRQAIGYALQGKDILGAAKTGSGKTLAFLVPILENLFCKKWTRLDGVGALVISPTRELAYQIYENLRKVGAHHDFSAGLIIGGQNLKFERKRMDQVNILICTPGRLLQHMDENPLFDCSHLQILVLDEADRCLDMGFATTLNAIVENLPSERQTLLFSATQTKSIKDLARLSLSFPTYVAPHEQALTVTPESLQQSYIVCDIHEKIGILWSFIRNHLKQKVLVFMSTCKQVKYTYDLFCKLRPGVCLLALYGTLHQEKREKIYNEFCRKSNVVLFATDLASRGLDFPRVNWVIQLDCPEDVDTYIHRAGRTARGIFGRGEGLLMLLPHEEKLVVDMENRKIPIKKISVDPTKVVAPQKKIEELLSSNEELKATAQRAVVSYLKSVFLMKNKEIFNVQLIDADAYARSLGLSATPTVKFMQKYKRNMAVPNKSQKSDDTDIIEKLRLKSGSDESATELEDEVRALKKSEKKKKDHDKQSKFGINLNIEQKDIFKVLRRNCEPENVFNIPTMPSKTNEKSVTKAAVVKNILKRKIKVNTQVKFNEDGDMIEDEKQNVKSDVAKQSLNADDGCDFDIEKAKKILEEEDKYDKLRYREKVKAKHRQQKLKFKNKTKDEQEEQDDFGSQSESDGPDLSWLPDPDKVYGGKGNSNSDVDSEELDSENAQSTAGRSRLASTDQSSDDDMAPMQVQRRLKRKLEESKDAKPRKAIKLDKISAKLSVEEAEMLAMQLLKT